MIFFLVVGGILALSHLYFWRRLARAPSWPLPVRRALAVAFLAMPLVALAGLSAPAWLSPKRATALEWIGGLWTGITFLLLVLLGVADLARGVAALTRRAARRPAFDADRRRLLARAVAGGVGAAAAGLATAAVVENAAEPAVVEIDVPIARLPPSLDGFRVAQLSDLHVGGLRGREFLAAIVARTNGLRPDVIAITGDLADGPSSEVASLLEPLADLRPADRVYFVTGNHEYFWGVDETIARIGRLGVKTLRNERVEIRRGVSQDATTDAALDVAGIDDATAHRFGAGHGADLDRALAGRDPARPVLLLAHQPRQVSDAIRLGVDLVLSGHTHGGQIFPFGLLVRLVQPAVKGLHRFGSTWLYVNAGTGAWGPPMRLGASAEITLLTLRRATDP